MTDAKQLHACFFPKPDLFFSAPLGAHERTAMKAILPAALFLVVSVLGAAPVRGASDSPNPEIVSLLNVLGTSQCQFYRNGSWYGGSEAQDHLQKKYDYLRKKGLADTAEQFIDNGGTKSSMSGEAYQVRCGDASSEPSAQWFREQLQRLRSAQSGKQSK